MQRKPITNAVPSIPEVEPRLVITPSGAFVPLTEAFPTAASRPSLQREARNVVDERTREVLCSTCSHDDCQHFHLPYPRLTRREAQAYLGYTENTLFTKHSRGEMPTAIAGPPLEFETCALAAFKFDQVILSRYLRAAHLAAIPAAQAARDRKKRAKSAKLSEHMRRRHAAARSCKPRRTAGRTVPKGGAR
jgi:hypothetical protein